MTEASAAGTRFPPGFLWGAATSAFQVEGSPLADGAGPSNWYRFTHTAGRIVDGSTGDVACDQYRRWEEDVELLRALGIGAYRFSLSWSRILPGGTGGVNRAGLDHYARLVDGLLARGIQPCVTLFHWDLPAALEEKGGWLNPEIVPRFAAYARTVFEALGDRVPLWATINEPQVVVDAGYLHGVHPPGHRNTAEAPLAAHHLLRAHGAAVRAHREVGRGRIGLVVNLEPKDPASDTSEDRAAADRADAYMNRLYLDAIRLGRYPEVLEEMFGDAWPRFPAEELAAIGEPIDFLGVNYYTRSVVRYDDSVPLLRASPVRVPGLRTETGWEVHPQGLHRVLTWVKERYGNPSLYVTENGAAFADPPRAEGGRLEDPLRVDYLRDHLRAAHAALEDGVDLRGYFVWSLLDNFEWAQGYTKRFGIVHVDFETQRRTPKASAAFYRDVIRSGGTVLDRAGVPERRSK